MPPFQLSFRSKPGAVLHQRNNKKLTACSSYSECKITFRVLTLSFSPLFDVTASYVTALAPIGPRSPVWATLARTGGGRVTLAPGASKTERKNRSNNVIVHQSGPTCVVSPLTHIAYCLLTCFIFLRFVFLCDILTLAKICGRSATAGRPCMLIGGGPR